MIDCLKKTLIVLLCTVSAYAQKPPIDATTYHNWASLDDFLKISNDGKWVSYIVNDIPAGSSTLFIKSLKNKWERSFQGLDDLSFSNDSRLAIFMRKNNLIRLTLGTDKMDSVADVTGFTVHAKKDILIYKLNNGRLVVDYLHGRKKAIFDSATKYWLSPDETSIVIQTTAGIEWVDLQKNARFTVSKNNSAGEVVFHPSGERLAFTINNPKEIWIFKKGDIMPQQILSSRGSGLSTAGISKFSDDGKRLFLNLEPIEKQPLVKDSNMVRLNVWTYQDSMLQTEQLHQQYVTPSYMAVIDIDSQKVSRLQYDHEIIQSSYPNLNRMQLLVEHKEGNPGTAEAAWNAFYLRDFFLVSAIDGSRKNIIRKTRIRLCQSPCEKFIVYFDPERNNYFAYEVSTGITRNITEHVPTLWTKYDQNDLPVKAYGLYSCVGWLRNDEYILLADKFDIWQVDPLGKKPALNITNGYGKRNAMKLTIAGISSKEVYTTNEEVLLIGFDSVTKDNGFLKARIGVQREPEKLSMLPYLFLNPGQTGGREPVKAKDANVYIVQRSAASESPNLFSTTDFKSFTRITDIAPERNYNWYTTELHSWKTSDGTGLQGVLYKPENFNPNKKYPVIFYYYERLSHLLHRYLRPEPSDGRLNIAWFVSNGYLVFCPDILYTTGKPGRSALDAVVSAADYLSGMSYINPKKMGIQGISYGGFETNYIVTHTDMFAAACTAAGASDMISAFGSLREGLYTSQELGQYRLGATIWDDLNVFIDNSAIFRAHKVTTPLLLFHTSHDGAVDFTQAIEFFTALRFFGKKSWLLEYNEGNHGVWGKSADDFSIRLAQYFDHYLRDKPAPIWMTKGIPASRKGVDDGLRLDETVNGPGESRLIYQH